MNNAECVLNNFSVCKRNFLKITYLIKEPQWRLGATVTAARNPTCAKSVWHVPVRTCTFSTSSSNLHKKILQNKHYFRLFLSIPIRTEIGLNKCHKTRHQGILIRRHRNLTKSIRPTKNSPLEERKISFPRAR